jgi:hypothetical protein
LHVGSYEHPYYFGTDAQIKHNKIAITNRP